MSVQISLNTTLTVNNGTKIQAPVNLTYTTTGSGQISNTVPVSTGSWQVVDQGTNKDFLIGAFWNMDTTSSIYIAIGNTSSFASILNPYTIDNCILAFSGSTTIYAHASGSNNNPLLNYTLVSNT